MITKESDGSFDAIELNDFEAGAVGELHRLETEIAELLSVDDIANVATAPRREYSRCPRAREPVGGTIRSAVRHRGGQLVANGRIPVQAWIAAFEPTKKKEPDMPMVARRMAGRERDRRTRCPHRGRGRYRGRCFTRCEPPPRSPSRSPLTERLRPHSVRRGFPRGGASRRPSCGGRRVSSYATPGMPSWSTSTFVKLWPTPPRISIRQSGTRASIISASNASRCSLAMSVSSAPQNISTRPRMLARVRGVRNAEAGMESDDRFQVGAVAGELEAHRATEAEAHRRDP